MEKIKMVLAGVVIVIILLVLLPMNGIEILPKTEEERLIGDWYVVDINDDEYMPDDYWDDYIARVTFSEGGLAQVYFKEDDVWRSTPVVTWQFSEPGRVIIHSQGEYYLYDIVFSDNDNYMTMEEVGGDELLGLEKR